MRHRILLAGLLAVFILTGSLYSQNIHFSRYDFQPLSLNPAMAGSFFGSVRASAIYRDQWANLLPNRFSTPAIGVDAPLGVAFRDQDWIGVGVSFFQDRAGAGKLTTTGFNVHVAYHLTLEKEQKNILTFALNTGSKNKKLGDIRGFEFEDQSTGEASLALESSGGTDMGGGILFSHRMDETDFLRIGFSAWHLMPIRYRLTGSGQEKERPEFNAHADASFSISPDMAIEPAIVYQMKEVQNLAYGQAKLAYTLDHERHIRLVGGLGYRLGRSAQVLAGLDYGAIRAGIGYDISTDPLTPAQSFEIGVSYIAKIYKRPKVKEVLLCPRF